MMQSMEKRQEVPIAESRSESASNLIHEATVFARYLLRRQPAVEVALLYADAESVVGRRNPTPFDCQIVDFAVRRPWALPWLDTACALMRPKAVLREKLLRLAAILEARPENADDFLPANAGLPATLCRLVAIGASSFVQLCLGAALLKGMEIRDKLAGAHQ